MARLSPDSEAASYASGLLLLNLVAMLWGSQHAIQKDAISHGITPPVLNFLRFGIAAVLFLPWGPWWRSDSSLLDTSAAGSGTALSSNQKLWFSGFELGIYQFLGFLLQTLGMQWTSAIRAAFLLYLNVKFVPILTMLFLRRQISHRTWVSVGLALLGTTLLCYDGSPPNIGDLICVGAALASAGFIVRLETFAPQFPSMVLTECTLISVTLLAGLVICFQSGIQRTSVLEPMVEKAETELFTILYLAVVVSGVGTALQTVGQRHVPAEQATIIFSMDPVYAAIFSYFWLGEEVGIQGLFGVALIIMGVLVVSLPRLRGESGDCANVLEADDEERQRLTD